MQVLTVLKFSFFRLKHSENESSILEMQLRQEIDSLSKSECRLRQRCDETESSLAREIREKDEFILKIKGNEARVQALANQLAFTEDEKADLEIKIGSLSTVLRRALGTNGGRRSKKMIPIRSSSPMKGFMDDDTESGFSFDGMQLVLFLCI